MMKNGVIFCMVVFLSMFAVTAEVREEPDEQSGKTVNGLQINLSANKPVCQPGEEITLTVTFANRDAKPFRVLVHDVFIGEELEVNRQDGETIPRQSGFIWHSPKVNLFLGRTFVLAPEEQKTISLEARLDQQYRLVFASPDSRENIPDMREVKRRLGLPDEYPDKYVSRGRVFPLERPGLYEIRFVYERAEADRQWTLPENLPQAEQSLDCLWLGKVFSNTIIVKTKN
ncbi:MAG: hypothetical protein RB296_03990 [Acidobacteriota bacterium]|jgi:hypothetical protein|nr:hypothetical protein [Acidobacteriota bacterium]